MVRVIAPSRLHFGVFALPPGDDAPRFWLDTEGRPTVPARFFGGVGLMIRHPGVEVTVEPAASWTATGTNSERALAFARMYIDSLREKPAATFAIHVRRCPPQHIGLGVGTQLALAIGTALDKALERELDPYALSARLKRGRRSAVGVHGFGAGGFLVEGGKKDLANLAPLLIRQPLPEEWRVLLVFPPIEPGIYGLQEEEVFHQLLLRTESDRQADALCRLTIMGLVPALLERDLPAFGEALYDFNRRVGELFRPWQGGVYAHPMIEAIVHWLRDHGIRGVGQSSWGPTIFAILEQGRDTSVMPGLQRQFSLTEKDCLITQASNNGARITE